MKFFLTLSTQLSKRFSLKMKILGSGISSDLFPSNTLHSKYVWAKEFHDIWLSENTLTFKSHETSKSFHVNLKGRNKQPNQPDLHFIVQIIVDDDSIILPKSSIHCILQGYGNYNGYVMTEKKNYSFVKEGEIQLIFNKQLPSKRSFITPSISDVKLPMDPVRITYAWRGNNLKDALSTCSNNDYCESSLICSNEEKCLIRFEFNNKHLKNDNDFLLQLLKADSYASVHSIPIPVHIRQALIGFSDNSKIICANIVNNEHKNIPIFVERNFNSTMSSNFIKIDPIPFQSTSMAKHHRFCDYLPNEFHASNQLIDYDIKQSLQTMNNNHIQVKFEIIIHPNSENGKYPKIIQLKVEDSSPEMEVDDESKYSYIVITRKINKYTAKPLIQTECDDTSFYGLFEMLNTSKTLSIQEKLLLLNCLNKKVDEKNWEDLLSIYCSMNFDFASFTKTEIERMKKLYQQTILNQLKTLSICDSKLIRKECRQSTIVFGNIQQSNLKNRLPINGHYTKLIKFPKNIITSECIRFYFIENPFLVVDEKTALIGYVNDEKSYDNRSLNKLSYQMDKNNGHLYNTCAYYSGNDIAQYQFCSMRKEENEENCECSIHNVDFTIKPSNFYDYSIVFYISSIVFLVICVLFIIVGCMLKQIKSLTSILFINFSIAFLAFTLTYLLHGFISPQLISDIVRKNCTILSLFWYYFYLVCLNLIFIQIMFMIRYRTQYELEKTKKKIRMTFFGWTTPVVYLFIWYGIVYSVHYENRNVNHSKIFSDLHHDGQTCTIINIWVAVTGIFIPLIFTTLCFLYGITRYTSQLSHRTFFQKSTENRN
ncbi:hypothetical protein SNEBB_006775, partial [Seison nebaliae]